jgi:DNA primase
MKCPLHNGKDYNCGIKQDYIHCFVCGESADVISFVINYYGLSFKEAITKLNNDFHLGLPIGEKLDRRKQIDLARKSFNARREREKQKNEHNRLKSSRETDLDEWVRLDKQRMQYKPKTQNEALHPLFVEAIINLPHAEYRLECAEMRLYQYETRNSCDT